MAMAAAVGRGESGCPHSTIDVKKRTYACHDRSAGVRTALRMQRMIGSGATRLQAAIGAAAAAAVDTGQKASEGDESSHTSNRRRFRAPLFEAWWVVRSPPPPYLKTGCTWLKLCFNAASSVVSCIAADKRPFFEEGQSCSQRPLATQLSSRCLLTGNCTPTGLRLILN